MTKQEAELLKRLQAGYKQLAEAYTKKTGVGDVYFFFGVQPTDLLYEPVVTAEPAACQHDLLAPFPTVTVDPADPYRATCHVCNDSWSVRPPERTT